MNRISNRLAVLAAVALVGTISSCSLVLNVEECAVDTDCERFAADGETWACNAGTCELASVAECTSDGDCDDGQTCQDNMCVGEDVEPDMGGDNNMVDMGGGDDDMGGGMEDMPPDDDRVIVGCDETPCRIRQNTEWTADKTWVLDEIMFIEPGVTLTVERGTTVLGNPGSALIIKRGGSLQARGTENQPIVFTSSAEPGTRLSGDWGGVALLGNAPVNQANAQLEGVADAGEAAYGGSNADSSCGALEYVRIEFAGFPLKLDEELNGLTLAGCGAGTIVSHVQIHKGKDDGLEIFGGTVNVRNVVITAAQDDSLDWDRGWTGSAQFLAIQQDDEGDNGFESDNWGDDNDATPRSNPVIYNYTIIGSKTGSGTGMTLKEGTAGEISHGIVMGSQVAAVDIKGTATADQALAGDLTVSNTYFFDIGPAGNSYWQDESAMADDDDGGFDEQMFFEDPQYNNSFANPNIPNPFLLNDPDLVPAANSPAADVGNVASGDFFDQSARYAGAFKPGAAPWTQGWTAYPSN